MFETGIGRAANLRVAARLPAASAHDLSPPAHYLTEDVVRQPLTMDAHGYVAPDEHPVALDEVALGRLCARRVVLEKA